MSKYSIGFWNYVKSGVLDEKQAVSDWVELGMNLAMSFEFDVQEHDKASMYTVLDECHKKGLKVIICDKRTGFREHRVLGEEKYRESVRQAVKDFGSHPATFGFHVGDEPLKDDWAHAIRAFVINKEEAKNLTPFINLFPYCLDKSFKDLMGVKNKEYGAKVKDFIKQTGAELISYDFYGQCGTFERQKWINVYFKNIKIFSEACAETGTTLFTCPLSVGHWSYRVPTENDLRWQLSTMLAHGIEGFMWFFVYERSLDGSYRTSPIDLFNHRTEMFDRLARQNNTYLNYHFKILENYKFDKVEHYRKAYGGFPKFKGEGTLKKINTVINAEPMSVSYFYNEKGEECIAVVNMSQDKPTCVKFTFLGEFEKYGKSNYWFAPGQMMIFTKEKVL